MPDEDQTIISKPAEMSFSDWKKMKSALSSSSENKAANASTSPNPKYVKGNIKNKQNKNIEQNKSNYLDNQSAQYFENLKMNNLRVFNQMGNVGLNGNQMLMMQAFNNMNRNYNMGPFNNMNRNNNLGSFNNNMGSFNNNMGSFNNNMGPFNNNMGPYNNNMRPYSNNTASFNGSNGPFNNNMSAFNNNMGPNNRMGPFNSNNMDFNYNNYSQKKPQRQFLREETNCVGPSNKSSGPNQHYNRSFTENYLKKRDEFFDMSNKPLPQQVGNPFRKPLTRDQNRSKKLLNDTKTKKANNQTKDGNQVETATKPEVEKKQKPKRSWKQLKPQMPPPIAAITPEALEAKQRMWREYRQQMKPFKNRKFLNAKRDIQRLKKKKYEELDEKEKDRWNKANEFINEHKKMLSERAIARGEAATTRAIRVQQAYIAEKQNEISPDIQTSSINNSASQNFTEYNPVKDQSLSAEAANANTNTENQYGLWNSFVPGGIVFSSTK